MGGEEENAVALKLPAFWAAQPQVWFAQAEAQFGIKNVTKDATRYYYVVAALDQHTAGRLVDSLSKPPGET